MLPKGGNDRSSLSRIEGFRLFGDRGAELLQRLRRLRGPRQQQCEVERDDGSVRKLRGQRPEAPEGAHRRPLRERADRGGDLRNRVVRRELRGRLELPLGRDAMPELPEREAVSQLRRRVGPARVTRHDAQLLRERPARLGDRGEDERQPALELRIEEVLRLDRLRRVGMLRRDALPRPCRVGDAARPVVRHAEMELRGRALRMLVDEPLQLVEAAVRPAREREPDLRLERVIAGEDRRRLLRLAVVQELGCACQRDRLRVVPHAELEKDEGMALLRLRHRARFGRPLTAALEERGPDRSGDGERGGRGDDREDARAIAHSRASLASRANAIFVKVMPNYRELLAQIRAEIDEVDSVRARELLDSVDPPLFVDIREEDEWNEGQIPGAVFIPRGNLESRIEAAAPDRAQPIVVYCAAGNRSVFGAKTLAELGYENVVSLAGGYTEWKRNGFPTALPRTLDPEKRARYSRHLLIPEVGVEGQLKLLQSRVLMIGAGGLGSPASLYLAAAGVGRLGIVDDDRVDASNLQRQIAHSTERLGEWKADSAKRTIEALNPDVEVVTYKERITSENVDRILADGWDVILDGADNFPTRYLINDASVFHDIPVVHGSIFRFEGQVSVFKPHEGPCYRCLFPQPPPPELAPSCAEGGVLGVLPGIVGSLQASEALKLALGIGETLAGRLLLFDALSTEFNEVTLRRDPNCPVCGEHPTITEYIDYVEFCSGRPTHA